MSNCYGFCTKHRKVICDFCPQCEIERKVREKKVKK